MEVEGHACTQRKRPWGFAGAVVGGWLKKKKKEKSTDECSGCIWWRAAARQRRWSDSASYVSLENKKWRETFQISVQIFSPNMKTGLTLDWKKTKIIDFFFSGCVCFWIRGKLPAAVAASWPLNSTSSRRSKKLQCCSGTVGVVKEHRAWNSRCSRLFDRCVFWNSLHFSSTETFQDSDCQLGTSG